MMRNNIKTLVIHLEKAAGRSSQVKKIEAGTEFGAHTVAAISADAADMASYLREYHKPRYAFSLRKTEVACFESHRRAWQYIIDEDLEFGLVLEDDADITDPAFSEALELALRHATAQDYVRFPTKLREQPCQIIGWSHDTRLFRPKLVGLGCVCQLVGRAAAQRLLNSSRQFDRPVDSFIQLHWITGVYPLCVTPSGVCEISSEIGGSLIHERNELSVRRFFSRTLQRLLFKIRMRLYSSQYFRAAMKKIGIDRW